MVAMKKKKSTYNNHKPDPPQFFNSAEKSVEKLMYHSPGVKQRAARDF